MRLVVAVAWSLYHGRYLCASRALARFVSLTKSKYTPVGACRRRSKRNPHTHTNTPTPRTHFQHVSTHAANARICHMPHVPVLSLHPPSPSMPGVSSPQFSETLRPHGRSRSQPRNIIHYTTSYGVQQYIPNMCTNRASTPYDAHNIRAAYTQTLCAPIPHGRITRSLAPPYVVLVRRSF